MTPDFELDITTAPKRNSLHWKPGIITWGEVLTWVNEPGTAKESGGYVLGAFRETEELHKSDTRPHTGLHRNKAGIVSRSALTLDADYAQGTVIPDQIELATGWAALVHTTFSSTLAAPRYRLIFPLDRKVSPREYGMLGDVVMARLGVKQFDLTGVQPERFMFKPAAEDLSAFRSWIIDGEPMPVDELLAEYDPDLSKIPLPSLPKNKRDPLDLDGVVGAFNRAYTVEDAILEYELPYVKVDAERWSYADGHGVAGLGLLNDHLAYSHHSTDPAGGKACSAFDLVRLHRFGELDEAAKEGTPINRLPSNVAMQDLASVDAKVVAELVGIDFDAEHTGPDDWKLGLRLSPRSGKFVDCVENWDLVAANDPVFAGLAYNEMTFAFETRTDLPWRTLAQRGPTFNSIDRVELRFYLERTYNVKISRAAADDLIDTTGGKRFFHPVEEYLKTLTWDGVPRLETCLPGVHPTSFTRKVARMVMTAAVARVFEPGIKWDHTIVLYGDEGLGKSWWVDRMFRGMSANLGPLADKDTLLILQRSWVMLADEGASLRKADADQQKEFLTRTHDVFRIPYDREVSMHPRRCVIWASTNDEVFLRRQEGNRRFLIVRCEEAVDFDAITDEYIDQVWAEALTLYRAGERIWLDGEDKAIAKAEREQYTEEDALGGIIQEYLETLVPEDWEEMSPEQRTLWRYNRSEGLVAEGTQHIDSVCSSQIWTEALGKRLGDHRRTDLLDISAALKRIPGWTNTGKPKRFRHYGPQVAFERDLDGEDLI